LDNSKNKEVSDKYKDYFGDYTHLFNLEIKRSIPKKTWNKKPLKITKMKTTI